MKKKLTKEDLKYLFQIVDIFTDNIEMNIEEHKGGTDEEIFDLLYQTRRAVSLCELVARGIIHKMNEVEDAT